MYVYFGTYRRKFGLLKFCVVKNTYLYLDQNIHMHKFTMLCRIQIYLNKKTHGISPVIRNIYILFFF